MMIVITVLFGLAAGCIVWGMMQPGVVKFTRRMLSLITMYTGGLVVRLCPVSWRLAWASLKYVEERITLFLLGSCIGVVGYLLTGHVLTIGLLGVSVLQLFPLLKMKQAFTKRRLAIRTALPAQLDLLAMLLAAGQPVLGSIQRSATGSSLNDNPLRQEMRHLVGKVRAGQSFTDALQDFSGRYPDREVRLFCGALNHARLSGAGLAQMLFEQASQRRQELFMQAEKQAMEAPVKLMFPLLIFIFPSTVLVLGVTLAAKLMWQL